MTAVAEETQPLLKQAQHVRSRSRRRAASIGARGDATFTQAILMVQFWFSYESDLLMARLYSFSNRLWALACYFWAKRMNYISQMPPDSHLFGRFANGGLLFSSITIAVVALISLYSFLLLVKAKFVVTGSFGG